MEGISSLNALRADEATGPGLWSHLHYDVAEHVISVVHYGRVVIFIDNYKLIYNFGMPTHL